MLAFCGLSVFRALCSEGSRYRRFLLSHDVCPR